MNHTAAPLTYTLYAEVCKNMKKKSYGNSCPISLPNQSTFHPPPLCFVFFFFGGGGGCLLFKIILRVKINTCIPALVYMKINYAENK